MIWFGIAGGACVYAVTLLWARYVRRSPHAVGSRGGFGLFALVMLLFAVGAAVAGVASLQAGR
jgi:hypothetical protein